MSSSKIVSVSDFTQQNTTIRDFDKAPVLCCYGMNTDLESKVYNEPVLISSVTTTSLSSFNTTPYWLVNINSISATAVSSGLYAYGGQRIYYRPAAGSWSWVHGDANTGTGQGMCGFNDNLYWASNNAVGSFDLNVTWNDSWQALNAVVPTPLWHPMIEAFGNMYVGDGNFVASWDKAAWVAQALDLPNDNLIVGLAEYASMLAILTQKFIGGGTSTPEKFGGELFLWDSFSDSYNSRYTIKDCTPQVMIVHKNILWVVTDGGEIRRFNGAGFDTVNRFPGMTENSRVSIIPGAITGVRDSILLGIYSGTNSLGEIPVGVWEYDMSDNTLFMKSRLYCKQVVDSRQSTTGYARIGCLLPAGSEAGSGITGSSDTWVGFRYLTIGGGSTYGVDVTGSPDSGFERGVILFNPIKNPIGVSKIFKHFVVEFDEFLNSDSSNKIIVKYNMGREIAADYSTWQGEQKYYTFSPGATSTAARVDTGTSLAAYGIGVGDELEIVSGPGSNETRHIVSITQSGATYQYNLDESFSTAPTTASLIVPRPFKKLGVYQGTGGSTILTDVKKMFTHRIKAPEIQFKIEMRTKAGNKRNYLKGFSVEYETKDGAR